MPSKHQSFNKDNTMRMWQSHQIHHLFSPQKRLFTFLNISEKNTWRARVATPMGSVQWTHTEYEKKGENEIWTLQYKTIYIWPESTELTTENTEVEKCIVLVFILPTHSGRMANTIDSILHWFLFIIDSCVKVKTSVLIVLELCYQ